MDCTTLDWCRMRGDDEAVLRVDGKVVAGSDCFATHISGIAECIESRLGALCQCRAPAPSVFAVLLWRCLCPSSISWGLGVYARLGCAVPALLG